jgi:3-oxoadipate enol-lactonase
VTWRVAELEGVRLRYEDSGPDGAGEALVLLHGFSLDARMWEAQTPAFAGRWRVIRYDLRGFGGSSLPDGPYAHPDDLCALLDHLGVSRAHLVGLSKGGGVALEFALTYPERTGALVLVDSALGGYAWSEEAKARDGLVWRRAKEAGVLAGRAAWLAHPLFEGVLASPAAADFRRIVGDYSGWHFVNTNPERRFDPPATARLSEVRAPTLVVVGEDDLPDFRRIADMLHQGVPGAELVVLPGVGHMASMEAPEAFNDLVTTFLVAHRGAGGGPP